MTWHNCQTWMDVGLPCPYRGLVEDIHPEPDDEPETETPLDPVPAAKKPRPAAKAAAAEAKVQYAPIQPRLHTTPATPLEFLQALDEATEAPGVHKQISAPQSNQQRSTPKPAEVEHEQAVAREL